MATTGHIGTRDHSQPPAVPAPNDGPSTYPLDRMNDDDKKYLLRMETAYRAAIKPISGQIYEDIATDTSSKTVWQLGGPQGGGAAFQQKIATVRAYAQNLPGVYQWDQYSYTGPLQAVLGAAIKARKDAGKAASA